VSRTTFAYLKPGDAVNLERPVRLSDRLGGTSCRVTSTVSGSDRRGARSQGPHRPGPDPLLRGERLNRRRRREPHDLRHRRRQLFRRGDPPYLAGDDARTRRAGDKVNIEVTSPRSRSRNCSALSRETELTPLRRSRQHLGDLHGVERGALARLSPTTNSDSPFADVASRRTLPRATRRTRRAERGGDVAELDTGAPSRAASASSGLSGRSNSRLSERLWPVNTVLGRRCRRPGDLGGPDLALSSRNFCSSLVSPLRRRGCGPP